jgi:hypothetical protein
MGLSSSSLSSLLGDESLASIGNYLGEYIDKSEPYIIEWHGEKLSRITHPQLRNLQHDLLKGKTKVGDGLHSPISQGSLGVKTNPLKAHKKTQVEEKKRGRKTLK